uniref:Uncharacterized protein n=1 Tax=Cacopsylla melanoneura TaxID=428564 RepID=A0A8D9BWJ3_9HEMI
MSLKLFFKLILVFVLVCLFFVLFVIFRAQLLSDTIQKNTKRYCESFDVYIFAISSPIHHVLTVIKIPVDHYFGRVRILGIKFEKPFHNFMVFFEVGIRYIPLPTHFLIGILWKGL